MARFKIGDRVILGRHEYIDGVGDNWVPTMNGFVGTIATITSDRGSVSGFQCWKVDTNGNY